MHSLTTIIQCTIALLIVLHVSAAPFDAVDTAIHDVTDHARSDNGESSFLNDAVSYRQANEEDSDEDSSEDDGEDDAEQAQQSIIEQQNQQNLEESQEGSDEEGGSEDDNVDDVRHRRRRRDTAMEQSSTTEAVITIENNNKEEQQQEQSNPTIEQSVAEVQPTDTTTTTATPNLSLSPTFNRTSVLILIRDTLKKVTTVLPTEQVATNALQYFQLFEHFLQQTIERVIDDYDDDDEESVATTIKVDEGSTVKEENITANPEINTNLKPEKMEVEKEMKLSNEIKTDGSHQSAMDLSSAKNPIEIPK